MAPNEVFRIINRVKERAFMGDSSWVSLLSHLQSTVVPKRIRNCFGDGTNLL